MAKSRFKIHTPSGWKQGHECRRVTFAGTSAMIDVRMAPLIKAAWERGIETSQCCQDNEPGIAWIQFPSAGEAIYFLSRVHAAAEFFWWEQLRGDEDVSLRFAAQSIPKMARALRKGGDRG